MNVNKGEVVTIIGSSGSGKSTLLRCINLLEKPTDGKIIYNGKNVLERGYRFAQISDPFRHGFPIIQFI